MIDSPPTAAGQLDAQMLASLRAVAAPRTYPPETQLTRQGETEHTFYVVEDGRVAVSRRLEDGTEQLLNVLGPRHIFGEMALLDDSPRLATITTLTETRVLELTAEQFKQLLRQDPDLALHITRRVLSNLRTIDQLAIHDLRTKNALLQEAYHSLKAAQAELVEKERLEREMELAAEMQRSLLPAVLPRYDDYFFAAYLAPARHVGGDLFGVQPLDDEHVALLIADVADKGMYAALLMAVTRTLFMQEAQRSLSPAEVTLAVHRGLMTVGGGEDGYSMDAFVTAFYGVLHRPSGCLTYVRAAQDRPLLLRPDQTLVSLPGDGRFLGMLPDLELHEEVVTLQPGDSLLLYSDGVTDAHNEADEGYGLERLKRVFQSVAGHGTETLDRLARDVNAWRGNAAAFDDVTMLLVEAVAPNAGDK
ncbi:MAG: SpoIIE family protein phosphatase [Candidatus Promineofilum sp.]|nr:SpoIIE family protein phosphatase [Promineifilum sp.]